MPNDSMKAGLSEVASAQGVGVDSLHTPAYSPKLNPAEYLNRLVRKNSLYHLPHAKTVQGRAERIQRHLAQPPLKRPNRSRISSATPTGYKSRWS